MIFDKKKKTENIVEYILFMWQVEDLIRACQFNAETIEKLLVKKFTDPAMPEADLRNWFIELSETMQAEGIKTAGHLQVVQNTVSDIADLHLSLIDSPEQINYRNAYVRAFPVIRELAAKTSDTVKNEIEICLTAVYGFVMLKMQNKPISEATQTATKQITELLSELAFCYKQREAGNLEV